MIKKIIFIFNFSALIFLVSCSSSIESAPFKFGIGKYKFYMADSSGKNLAEGILNVTGKSGDNISGSYEFKNIYNKDFPGLSTMDGKFEGNIIEAEKKVFINTNPRIADSNVFWNLVIKNNYLTGEWIFSVFRGTSNRGKVKITK